MVTPTGLPQFNNFNDLEKKWVHNDSVGLFRTLFTRPHFLSPEIPFIDPPDPVLPDQGDGNKPSTNYCEALSVRSDKINILTAALAQECFFGVL